MPRQTKQQADDHYTHLRAAAQELLADPDADDDARAVATECMQVQADFSGRSSLGQVEIDAWIDSFVLLRRKLSDQKHLTQQRKRQRRMGR